MRRRRKKGPREGKCGPVAPRGPLPSGWQCLCDGHTDGDVPATFPRALDSQSERDTAVEEQLRGRQGAGELRQPSEARGEASGLLLENRVRICDRVLGRYRSASLARRGTRLPERTTAAVELKSFQQHGLFLVSKDL